MEPECATWAWQPGASWPGTAAGRGRTGGLLFWGIPGRAGGMSDASDVSLEHLRQGRGPAFWTMSTADPSSKAPNLRQCFLRSAHGLPPETLSLPPAHRPHAFALSPFPGPPLSPHSGPIRFPKKRVRLTGKPINGNLTGQAPGNALDLSMIRCKDRYSS